MRTTQNLSSIFEENAPQVKTDAKRSKRKRPAPLSLRLNDAELRALREAASGRSINGYIRDCLFGNGATISLYKPPAEDFEALARVLGALGRSDVYTTLSAICLALEEQRLIASQETEASVREACDLIVEMRSDLLVALGLRKERM